MSPLPDCGSDTVPRPGEPSHQVELSIGGMTCASCAARVEKRLNRLAGVRASVNFATETARVSYPDGITPEDLVAAVARSGYTAALPPDRGGLSDDAAGGDTEYGTLRGRLRGGPGAAGAGGAGA